MTDIDEGANSDNEVRPRSHKKLLAAVSSLNPNNTRHIKAPTRSEPILARSEFNLVKGGRKAKPSSIHVDDLVNALKKTRKHLDIGKELKKTKSSKKLLDKPLEKHVTDKIQRTLGYDKTKQQLGRWDAVVSSQRAADHVKFPLLDKELNIEINAPAKDSDFRMKSDLWLEMENVLKTQNGGVEVFTMDEAQNNATLSREEMLERRNELRRLRVLEAQKGAKARRQNKIKSKKFHKLMKQEKLKQEMKDFDELQKRDPEAALNKLEQLEKNRVKERATQRHRNTGTWAQNLKVRAKYDKDVRFELAQQVALSRELTAKNKMEDDSDEEEAKDGEKVDDEDVDPFNPWVKKQKQNAEGKNDEVGDFVSGYKKYWEERNKNEQKLKEHRNGDDLGEDNDGSGNENENIVDDDDKISEEINPTVQKISKKTKKSNKSSKMSWTVEDADEDMIPSTESMTVDEYKKAKKLKKSSKKLQNLDDIFDAAEEALRSKVSKKIMDLKSQPKSNLKKNKNKKNPSENDELSHLNDLSFKKAKTLASMDEEMSETTRRNKSESEQRFEKLKKLNNQSEKSNPPEDAIENELNPENFVKVKPKMLHTAIPDTFNTDEMEDTDAVMDQKRMTIAEAFEDDDIVADFARDKDDTRKSGQLEDIDLTLPGWGSWAGSGIKPRASKLKLTFNKNLPRKDDRSQNVIINEKPNEKLRQHQISELPFPFTSVKDFEASIRAPVSNTFIPNKASRLMTMPAVETKMGTIIEPMNEEMLLKKEAPSKSIIEQRIAKLKAKTAEKKRKHKMLA